MLRGGSKWLRNGVAGSVAGSGVPTTQKPRASADEVAADEDAGHAPTAGLGQQGVLRLSCWRMFVLVVVPH